MFPRPLTNYVLSEELPQSGSTMRERRSIVAQSLGALEGFPVRFAAMKILLPSLFMTGLLKKRRRVFRIKVAKKKKTNVL